MPTLIDVLTAVAGLFRHLGLEPLFAATLVVVLAALLARRVMAAVRMDPDDPDAGYPAAARQHTAREDALDALEETNPDAFHRRVEEDAELAALVAESEAWWREGRQAMFGDGASD